MRAKAVASLTILAEYGNTLREPYSKAVGKGLFELRIRFAGDITRIFYFFFVYNRIILTNGFIKKTQKTPPSEIALAMKYKADYEGRNKKK
jgi:phage-related protein